MSYNFHEYKKNRKIIDIKQLPTIDNTDTNQIYHIAIIIPHRDRIKHLQQFIMHIQSMSKLISNNKLDIYIIDQNNADKFNRGFLLNIGYLIAKKHHSYDRYIFHDVDSYPDEELFKLYFKYINYNIHLASPNLGYKYNFYTFFGGVIAFKKEDFEKINGFPNTFFGWGGEDDALFNRCAKYDIEIYRPSKGTYILPDHDKPTETEINTKRQKNVIEDLQNYKSNGIRQLLDYFINIKKYDINDFIKNYPIIDTNHTNGSSSIQSYLDSSTSNILNSSESITFYTYKIDYLATHSFNYDKFLNKDYVEEKIKKKLNDFKGKKYFQHPIHKEIISIIEPLIYINEIKSKIFSTYTELKKFQIPIKPKLIKEQKIFKSIGNFFSKYSPRTKDDLFNTITFIFNTYNELLYFRIRDNKIECSFHLYNLQKNIDMLQNIKYINKTNKIQNLDQSLVEIMNSTNKDYQTLRKPHNIPTNNCLMGFDSYNYYEGIPSSYIKEFIEMLQFTIDIHKDVPDCDILINRKDFPYLRLDNRYAYDHILKGDDALISNPINYYFIGSQSSKDINLDIPIPSADEWKDIDTFKNLEKVPWSEKKPIAFFRGSSTGCGTKITNNPRLLLADISYKWKKIPDKSNLIDVAFSRIVARIKVYDQFIGIQNQKEYAYLLGSFVNTNEQLRYKYIFNIEGNAQAYRYPNEFKKRSLILNVESEFHMWFEPLLINNKHMINIKPDYSNLLERLLYLNANDSIAKKIASNGYKFSIRYINKKMIATYWLYYMYNVNQMTI